MSSILFPDFSPLLAAILTDDLRSASQAISLEEMTIVSQNASRKRIEQFQLGRYAARLALMQIGISEPVPLLRNSNRLPIWPDGIVGSLSHTAGCACAAVARDTEYTCLGIDIEQIRSPRQDGLVERLFTEENARYIKSDPLKIASRFTTYFSACEAIYKALSPIASTPPSFGDVHFSEDVHPNHLTIEWRRNRTSLTQDALPHEVFISSQDDAVVTLCAVRRQM